MTEPKTNKNTPSSFNSWMKALDKKLIALIYVSTSDLADQNYYDWWEDGMSIEEAVAELAEYEGFTELLDQ